MWEQNIVCVWMMDEAFVPRIEKQAKKEKMCCGILPYDNVYLLVQVPTSTDTLADTRHTEARPTPSKY